MTDPKSTLTGAELLSGAEEIVAAVRRACPLPRPLVGVALPLSVDAIVVLVAAILGDYSVCMLDPAAPDLRRASITDAVRPHVVIDEHGVRPAQRPFGPPGGCAGYVAMSSGSTGGAPKGVLTRWSTIAEFAPFGADVFELDGDASWAEIGHPAYDMAMTNLLIALWAGATIHVTSSLGDRVRPLRFVDRVAATHLRLAPRFIDLAAAERRAPGANTLRVWGSGGDRLFATQARQVFEFGVPGVVTTYGTSETAGFASAARLTADQTLRTVCGSVTIGDGRVGPWRARVVQRESDMMLAISSPHRPPGYLFGVSGGEFPRWEGDDVVLTGDVGAEDVGGLFCLGRAGRRVKRNARFVDLDEVDATIRSATGAVSFTVAGADGTLTSLIESKTGGLDEFRESLAGVLSRDVLPERLVPVPQLPRLGNGKVDHAAAHSLAPGKDDDAEPRNESAAGRTT